MQMKILLSGSTGMVGSALVPYLTAKGHTVTPLVRTPAPGGIEWNPDRGQIDAARLEGFDAVVHLSGESIAAGRWTAAKKRRILESRVKGTQLLATTLAGLQRPPKTFICASAIGFYGSRGNETLQEDSPAGTDFLADVCRAWENATLPAMVKGIRVVNLRFGIILSTKGGALAKMLPPFKLGVGGKFGSGNQFMSWVAIDDVLGVVLHALDILVLKGPVNTVAPEPVTNTVYTETLGRVLSRPTLFTVPAFAAKLAFGEMADAMLLSSQKVHPAALQKTGYTFRYPTLELALKHILKN